MEVGACTRERVEFMPVEEKKGRGKELIHYRKEPAIRHFYEKKEKGEPTPP